METVDLSKLSVEELKAAIAEKEKAQKNDSERRKEAYIADRDKFITETVNKLEAFRTMLKEFKEETFISGKTLHEQMFDIFGREHKELQSFHLETENGQYKLQFERRPIFKFDETAQVGIDLIKEILDKEYKGEKSYKHLQDILTKNSQGDYDERLVAKLRKRESEIEDRRFPEALNILSAAQYISGTALYVRGYKRNDNKQWEELSIQFSSL
jgi:hypothetical protein